MPIYWNNIGATKTQWDDPLVCTVEGKHTNFKQTNKMFSGRVDGRASLLPHCTLCFG